MKHKKIIIPIRWLLFAVLVTATVSSVTLARYMTTVTGYATAQIAKWDVQLSSTENIASMNFDGSRVSDNEQIQQYKFTVTNNSEVDATYSIQVSFDKALPESVSLWIDDNGNIQFGDGKVNSFTFDGFNLAVNAAKEHTLNIKVKYADNDKVYTFTDFTEIPVTITVTAEQAS